MSFNADLFDRAAADYDEEPPFFTTLGRALVRRAGVPDGSRVVDLGAGEGAVTMALRASMPTGPIAAVDSSEAMLRHLRRLALPGVVPVLADLERLPYADASFDHAVSGFTLHILTEPAAAAREIHRVLRRGGTLTWSMPGHHPEARGWAEANGRIFADFLECLDATPAEMDPGPSPHEVLGEAGFTVVRATTVPVEIPVADAEAYWRWTQSHGARWLTDALPADDAEALHRAVVSSLEDQHPTQGRHIMVAPILTTLRR